MVATGAINERLEQVARERVEREAAAQCLVTAVLEALRCRMVIEDATAPDGQPLMMEPVTIGLATVGWRIEAL